MANHVQGTEHDRAFFYSDGLCRRFRNQETIKRCVAPFGSSLFRPTCSFALQSHFHTLDARRGRRINVVICSLNPSPFLFKHSLRNNLRLPHTFPHCQSTSSDYWCHHGRAWFAGRERIVEIASGGRKDRGPETWRRNEKRWKEKQKRWRRRSTCRQKTTKRVRFLPCECNCAHPEEREELVPARDRQGWVRCRCNFCGPVKNDGSRGCTISLHPVALLLNAGFCEDCGECVLDRLAARTRST